MQVVPIPGYEATIQHLPDPFILPVRVYLKMEEIMTELSYSVAKLDHEQAVSLLRERGVTDRHFYVEAENGQLLPYVLGELVESAQQQADDKASYTLLLEDLRDSLTGDNDLLALLRIGDPETVLYQQVEVAYQGESDLLDLHEETVAALALMSHWYISRISFVFPDDDKQSDTDLAEQFYRYNYPDRQEKYKASYKVVFQDETTYYFHHTAFLQGVNTFFSWTGKSQPYRVFLLDEDGIETELQVL